MYNTPHVDAGTVAGTIAGLDAGTEVVLRSFDNGTLVNVASATLDSTGGFALVPESPLKSGYHQLLAGRKHPLVLITNSTEGVHIEAKAREGENYMVNARITGSPQSVTVAEYYDVIMPLQQGIKEAERDARSVDGQKRQAAKDARQTKLDSITTVSLEFAQAHGDELAALSALESLNASEHKDVFRATLESLKAAHSESYYYGKIKKAYDEAMRPRKIEMANPDQRRGKNSKFIHGTHKNWRSVCCGFGYS